MEIHIGYEDMSPFLLKRLDVTDEKARQSGHAPKPILKADMKSGRIVIDTETTLSDVPSDAWEYRLANRSALEWVLDQYKEKTPKDLTIRTKLNAYHFAEYKEDVLDLLCKVTTVSIETMKVVNEMKTATRD